MKKSIKVLLSTFVVLILTFVNGYSGFAQADKYFFNNAEYNLEELNLKTNNTILERPDIENIKIDYRWLNVRTTRSLLAKYTLNNTAVDATGNNGNITLTNAPYQSDGSVYSNGIYPYNNPNGSTIRTPIISSFNFENFTVSFDFKIDSIPTSRMPVIVGGSSYRWIGVNVESNGKISMLWNNSNITYSNTTVPINTYNNVIIQYNGSVAEVYLNGTLVCSQNYKPRNIGDSNFQNVNYSNCTAFKGYLKNLNISCSPIVSPKAKYTLNQTAVDATGNNGNITLTNAPYQSDGSVYSNGIYPYNNPNGSTIKTPFISSFDFENFTVSFEFKIDSIPTSRMPVIVGGSSYRWIGVNVESNGRISMLWNNSNITNSNTTVPLNTYNNVVIQYNGSVAEVYLNGTLVCSQNYKPMNIGDSNFQNVNYSNGTAFKGNLRNLQIY